jgi:hypothetical protein
MVGLWDLISLVRALVREKGNLGMLQFHHNPHPKISLLSSQTSCLNRERNQARNQVRSLVKSITPSLSTDQSVSIVSFVERMVTRKSFAIRIGERREMAKEWANKDRYHTSHDVPEPRVQLPRAKASVRTVPAWGERKAVGGAAGRATPVRPVRGTGQTGAGLDRQQFGFHACIDAKFGSGGRGSDGWSREFADGRIARHSPPRAQYGDGRGRTLELERRDGPQLFVVLVLLWLVRGGSLIMVTMVVLSLLDILHLVINTSLGEVAVLSLRRAADHAFLFVVVVLLQWDRSGLSMVVLGLTGWIAILIGMVG